MRVGKLNPTPGASGMLIEEGILSGVGETIDDVINSLTMVRTLDFDQVG